MRPTAPYGSRIPLARGSHGDDLGRAGRYDDREAIGERWIAPRRRWGRERLARAIAEKQARADLPIDAALTNLYSVVYSPLLLGRSVLPSEMLDACLDVAFTGIFLKQR